MHKFACMVTGSYDERLENKAHVVESIVGFDGELSASEVDAVSGAGSYPVSGGREELAFDLILYAFRLVAPFAFSLALFLSPLLAFTCSY